MKFFYILYFVFFIIKQVASLHLNGNQIKMINNLLKNPDLRSLDREKINSVLYIAYEKFAIKKALEFKSVHKYKCTNMQKEEIILSSKIGLFKAIQKYNGKYDFINYATIYINSELFRLLTDKYSLSSLPKSYRSASASRRKKDATADNKGLGILDKYNHLLDVKLSILYEPWQLDSIFVSNEDIVNKINEKYEKREKYEERERDGEREDVLFTKRIYYLKYYFKSGLGNSRGVLSNNEISKLMCCSEETIREKLKGIKE
jgi:hypothetical protein